MHDRNVIDAPVIEPRSPNGDDRWKQEYLAFQGLLPDLLKSHRDRFVAICDGVVVAVADTFKDAAMEAYSRCGYVPLHVGKVSEAPVSPVRIPFNRVT